MLLRAYAAGIFPMAENAEAQELHWFDPPVRALIPLDSQFHIPRRLARTLRQAPYQVTVNRAFQDVMEGCAEPHEGRKKTWINSEILRLYTALYYRGNAHSIEIWENRELVGGLYGVSLGGAFFGESMFSRKKDASKIALVHLVGLLRQYGYKLLDTQFQTSHLERFGTFEIVRSIYLSMLGEAMNTRVKPFSHYPDWDQLVADVLSLQPVTQIS
jgi:leucyl/phenylalanyl-tRNA---protein transferase